MENPEQPQYQQQQYQQQPTQADPGKTLGIVGFIFAFVGLQLVGLILSILGFNKSRKAGFKNGLALAGIILNSIFLVFVTIITFLIFITVVSYSGTSDHANTAASKASATTVLKYSELYHVDNGVYPKTFAEINHSTNISASSTPFLFGPSTPSTIEFYSCGEAGNKIGYFDYDEKTVLYLYSGNATASSDCTFSNS